MTEYKLVPTGATTKMLEAGEYAQYTGCYVSGIYADMLAEAPIINIVATKNEQGQIVSVTLQDEDRRILQVIAEADVQEEPVASAPVAAQQRFRHIQKSTRDWSPWQPASINLDRPSWEIDSQGYEVEYRLLYDAPQPTKTDVERLAMEAVMESIDPATWPGLTTAQRCALGRFAKPQPAEQQREPCHECGGNGAGGEHEEDCSQQPATEVERHLVETLLQQYEADRHLTLGRWIEHGPFAKLFATYPKQRGKP